MEMSCIHHKASTLAAGPGKEFMVGQVLEYTDSPGAVESTVNSKFGHCLDRLLSSADETGH